MNYKCKDCGQPCVDEYSTGHICGIGRIGDSHINIGISRRDLFAAMAMQSSLSKLQELVFEQPPNITPLINNLIRNSAIVADAMIRELDKKDD